MCDDISDCISPYPLVHNKRFSIDSFQLHVIPCDLRSDAREVTVCGYSDGPPAQDFGHSKWIDSSRIKCDINPQMQASVYRRDPPNSSRTIDLGALYGRDCVLGYYKLQTLSFWVVVGI